VTNNNDTLKTHVSILAEEEEIANESDAAKCVDEDVFEMFGLTCNFGVKFLILENT